jgi:hypothetical protein
LNDSGAISELPIVRHLEKARHAGASPVARHAGLLAVTCGASVLAVVRRAGLLAMAGRFSVLAAVHRAGLLAVARRVGVLFGAAVAGVLVAAGPAAADVAVSPTSAPQGSGANLTFRVANTGSSPITRIKLVLPPDTPVAEVYPLSVDDWAPQITQQKLTHPLTTIHGGTPVTETAKDITWIAMPGKAIAPGGHADLSIALGPLPTVSRMSFEMRATYADGKAGPAIPPVVLALTPAVAGQAPAHGHAGTATAGSDDAAFAAAAASADRGPSWWSIAGWIAAALLAAGMVVAYLRSRRRGEDPTDTKAEETNTPASAQDADDIVTSSARGNTDRIRNTDAGRNTDADRDDAAKGEDANKEPVAAGTRLRPSSWRYRDTPQ